MKFETALRLVGDLPTFETGMLLAGAVDPADVRRQLSRWKTRGRLEQLRRGLYVFAQPYRKVEPHPFVVANRIQAGSYVSMQSALAFAGMIPEYVAAVTSVCTARPTQRHTPLGSFIYRHIKTELFWGYRRLELSAGQQAFVAYPEKALLDLFYLHPGADDPAYIEQLRLQNLDLFNLQRFDAMVERVDRPKLRRAAELLRDLCMADDFEPL